MTPLKRAEAPPPPTSSTDRMSVSSYIVQANEKIENCETNDGYRVEGGIGEVEAREI